MPSYNFFLKKWAIQGLVFFIVVFSTDCKLLFDKCYRCLDLNPGPLVVEPTALSIVPQPLPSLQIVYGACWHRLNNIHD